MLQKTQSDALALRSRDIAQKFLKKPAGPVAFVNVRAFVDGNRFVGGQTVMVDHGLITQVGPTGSVNVPSVHDLAKDFNVSPARLRVFNPEVYEAYLGAYQNQGGSSVRYARGKAFSATRRRLENIDIKLYRPRFFWWLLREIEKEANVSQLNAFEGYWSALLYLQLLAMARNQSLMLFAAKNDTRWLEAPG